MNQNESYKMNTVVTSLHAFGGRGGGRDGEGLGLRIFPRD